MNPPEKKLWKGGERPVTAVVFSGAGASIIVEAGMARAWHDSGLVYDMVMGVSSGAITAAFLHAGQINELSTLCTAIKNKDVYRDAPWKAFGKESCILDNAPLEKLLRQKLDKEALRKAAKSCSISATSMETWRAESYELTRMADDDIVSAILASCSLPALFPLHNQLIDGGVVDNFPVFDAMARQADRIVLFTPYNIYPLNKAMGAWELIQAALQIALYNQLIQALRSLFLVHSSKIEILVVHPETVAPIGLLDFEFGDEASRLKLMNDAYADAKTHLIKLWGCNPDWVKAN